MKKRNWLAATLSLFGLSLVGSISEIHANETNPPQPLILVAKPTIQLSGYRNSVLLAIPVGKEQHIGFFLNRPTRVTLGKLFPEHEPSNKVREVVYFGGPERETALFALLNSTENPGDGSIQVSERLFLAVAGKTVDSIIEKDAAHARFYVGFIVWRPGELRQELKRNLWHTLDMDEELVFRKSTEKLWEELFQKEENRANGI